MNKWLTRFQFAKMARQKRFSVSSRHGMAWAPSWTTLRIRQRPWPPHISTGNRIHGINWKRKRLCDVFHGLDIKADWYFPCDSAGAMGGDHYRTIAELTAAIERGELNHYKGKL